MRRRTRVIAGILGLVAMTFALAETVAASTCAPGMDMETMDMATMEMDMSADGSQQHDRQPAGEDEGRCPLGPLAATQGCVGAASLPGQSLHGLAASLGSVSISFAERSERDLLLVHSLFHPPRA